jgi:hypothetical protein
MDFTLHVQCQTVLFLFLLSGHTIEGDVAPGLPSETNNIYTQHQHTQTYIRTHTERETGISLLASVLHFPSVTEAQL